MKSLDTFDPSPVDFECLDRRERLIQRQLLLCLITGILLGAVAPAPTAGPMAPLAGPLLLVVMLVVGRVSLGVGWAAVNTGLTVAGLACGRLVTVTARGQSLLDVPGSDRMLLLLVLAGVLAQIARHVSPRGDAAAAVLAMVLAAGVLDDTGPWTAGYVPPAWPWGSAAAFGFGLLCVAMLRRRAAADLGESCTAGAVTAAHSLAGRS
ncbi:hypothetical protein [Microbispora sp. NPDC049125]|uniref:hypothetical protein n=1 Tax=Microbispora sp. NPDC049125 TaxID=3154929 RepID=UPI0034652931